MCCIVMEWSFFYCLLMWLTLVVYESAFVYFSLLAAETCRMHQNRMLKISLQIRTTIHARQKFVRRDEKYGFYELSWPKIYVVVVPIWAKKCILLICKNKMNGGSLWINGMGFSDTDSKWSSNSLNSNEKHSMCANFEFWKKWFYFDQTTEWHNVKRLTINFNSFIQYIGKSRFSIVHCLVKDI